MINVYHKVCGQVAFYCDHVPMPGDLFTHKGITLLDGSQPEAYDLVVCGSCGNNAFPGEFHVKEWDTEE